MATSKWKKQKGTVMVDCQPHRIKNHMRDGLQGIPIRDHLGYSSWCGKTSPNCGWDHFLAENLGLDNKESEMSGQKHSSLWCGCHVTSCLGFPVMIICTFEVWARANPFCLRLLWKSVFNTATGRDIVRINTVCINTRRSHHLRLEKQKELRRNLTT